MYIPTQKRQSPRGDATRDRILDAAEKLFAEGGFEATSVRDICAEAQAELGTVGYHFRSKDDIYTRVLARRSEASSANLRTRLEQIRSQRGDKLTIDDVLGSFAGQLFDILKQSDQGQKHYLRIVMQRVPVESSGRLHPALAEHYVPVRKFYLQTIKSILPALPNSVVDWGFSLFELSFGSALFSSTQDRFAMPTTSRKKIENLEHNHICLYAEGLHAIAKKYSAQTRAQAQTHSRTARTADKSKKK